MEYILKENVSCYILSILHFLSRLYILGRGVEIRSHTYDEIARLRMHAASARVFAILKYFLAGLDLNKSNCSFYSLTIYLFYTLETFCNSVSETDLYVHFKGLLTVCCQVFVQ